MNYLRKDSCRIEKAHYGVLIALVQQWEDEFWPHAPAYLSELFTPAGKFALSLGLFKRYNILFAGSIEELFSAAMHARGPLLALAPELVPQRILDEVGSQLTSDLSRNPALLFDGKPLLAPAQQQLRANHQAAVVEMAQRIVADRHRIAEAFFDGHDFGRICNVDFAGDCHGGGRQTCIVATEGGTFIYRPRDVSIDMAFRTFATEFFPDEFTVPRTLACKEYGYSEFIASRRAEGPQEAELFFYHMGGLCMAAQLLGSTDMHTENIVANGVRPAVVDVETVLSPVGFGTTPQPADREGEALRERFAHDWVRSLGRSGILPRMSNGQELSPLLNKGKDSLLPLVDGACVDAHAYLPALLAGFEDAYRRCLRKRPAIDAALRGLGTSTVRVLLCDTNVYAKWLQRQYSPLLLSSRRKTEETFARWTKVQAGDADDEGAHLALQRAVAQAETEALRRGDIPLFSVPADSRSLLCDGRLIAENAWEFGPLELARDRLARLSERELQFERALLEQSVQCAIELATPDSSAAQTQAAKNSKRSGTSNTAATDNASAPSCKSAPYPAREPHAVFAGEADSIFSLVRARMVESPNGSLVLLDNTQDKSSFGVLKATAGLGFGGVALFLAEYYLATGAAQAKTCCQRLMEPVFAAGDKLVASPQAALPASCRGFLLLGGMLRILPLVGRCIDDEAYEQLALVLFDALCRTPDGAPCGTDFYSGTAGGLYAACTHEPFAKSAGFAANVRRLAEELAAGKTLAAAEGPYGWDTLDKGWAISGLGHGQAGVGLALMAAARALDDDSLRACALDAFRLEHALYRDDLGTWPDLRSARADTALLPGICSGAPGVGLALLRLHEWGISEFDSDLTRAINAVQEGALAPRDHYCCGNSAGVEFLLEAGRSLGREDLVQAAECRLHAMLARKQTAGSYTFLPAAYRNYTPVSLFSGISGVGHVLLRSLHPTLSCPVV